MCHDSRSADASDNEPEPLLYDAEQAAKRLGNRVTAYWLKRKAALRLIPCTYVGKSPSWSGQDLLELIELRRNNPRNYGGKRT